MTTMIDDHQFSWLKKSHEKLQEEVTLLRIDVAKLKVQSGVWGLLAGAIPVAILVVLLLVKGAL